MFTFATFTFISLGGGRTPSVKKNTGVARCVNGFFLLKTTPIPHSFDRANEERLKYNSPGGTHRVIRTLSSQLCAIVCMCVSIMLYADAALILRANKLVSSAATSTPLSESVNARRSHYEIANIQLWNANIVYIASSQTSITNIDHIGDHCFLCIADYSDWRLILIILAH